MQVAVAGVELNRVEAGLACADGPLRELLADLRDPADAQLDRGLAEQRLGNRRRRLRLKPVDVVSRRLTARVS
jgi:hypothetical protein